jgi:hypothetical protein
VNRFALAQTDARRSDWVVYLLGVAGLTASIAVVFLAMRAVMDIGGYCAEGGPYVIETHCPEGVPLLMTLAFPAGFGAAGLMIWRGSRLGAAFAGLVAVAWPALFLSLGWNFLEFGVNPPGGGGLEWGWLICAVVFFAMGGLPLYAALKYGGLVRRPSPELRLKIAAIAVAVASGLLIGYVVFRSFAG